MTGPTGMLKVVVHAVAPLASFLLVVVATALMPRWLGPLVLWALVGGVVLLAAGCFEGSAVQLVTRSRAVTSNELQVLTAVPGLGPGSRVRVRRRPTAAPVVVMGRHIVVSGRLVETLYHGWVSPQEAAALVVHARGHHQVAAPPREIAVAVTEAPWRAVTGAFRGFGRGFAWLPLGSLAWRLRGVVGVVCLVQSVAEGRTWPGVLGAAVIVLTYLVPAAGRAVQRRAEVAGDRAVVEQGLGEALVAVLQRSGHQVPVARLQRLRQQPEVSPAAGTDSAGTAVRHLHLVRS